MSGRTDCDHQFVLVYVLGMVDDPSKTKATTVKTCVKCFTCKGTFDYLVDSDRTYTPNGTRGWVPYGWTESLSNRLCDLADGRPHRV